MYKQIWGEGVFSRWNAHNRLTYTSYRRHTLPTLNANIGTILRPTRYFLIVPLTRLWLTSPNDYIRPERAFTCTCQVPHRLRLNRVRPVRIDL